MKNLIKWFSAVFLSTFIVTAHADGFSISNLTSKLSIPAPSLQVLKDAQSAGIFQATNYAIEPYLTYAPKNAAGDNFGAGVLAVYNLNDYVGAGLGVDYLGQFSLVSGNATLKVPIHVGDKVNKYIPANWIGVRKVTSELTVVPFVLGGIGTPLSGSPTTITTIADVGGYIQYGHLWGGKFNTGVCWGKWINAGEYSGTRYHIFAGWSRGF
jgi:hypothetical protein